MTHSFKVKIKEKNDKWRKKIEYKRQLGSKDGLGNNTKERERKKLTVPSCFRLFFAVSVAFFFSWWPQEQKGSLRKIRLTLHRTGLFSKWICGSFSLTKLWYQLKSHFLILHDQADNCQLMNYLYLYSNLARKSFSSGNTDGLIQTFCES